MSINTTPVFRHLNPKHIDLIFTLFFTFEIEIYAPKSAFYFLHLNPKYRVLIKVIFLHLSEI